MSSFLAAIPETEDRRVVDLRRMRVIATTLLGVMTAVFVATSYYQQRWEWLAYVRAFAEAGMVGACADWFAVVALFRHPMGIPIPHTGIVPQNKKRIAGALGRFISNNFLTPRVLSGKLADVDASRWIAEWLARPENAARIARTAATWIPEIASALPREEIARAIGNATRSGLESVPAAPLAANVLGIIWAQGQTQKLIERALELAEDALVKNKDAIRSKIESSSSRWIPKWIDGIVAEKAIAAVTRTLVEIRDPGHPWRTELGETVEALIERLSSDEKLRADVEAAKITFLNSPILNEQAGALWGEIRDRLPKDLSQHADRIAAGVEHALLACGRWLREDEALKTRINRWLRHAIRNALSSRRNEIGAYVTHVVESWDATTLVGRLELQVGKDLQYIRINGTLVGGLVGLIIYTVSTWLLPP